MSALLSEGHNSRENVTCLTVSFDGLIFLDLAGVNVLK